MHERLARVQPQETDPGDAPVTVRKLHAAVRPRQRVGHVRAAERLQMVAEAGAEVRVGRVLGLRAHLLYGELTPLVCGVPLAKLKRHPRLIRARHLFKQRHAGNATASRHI